MILRPLARLLPAKPAVRRSVPPRRRRRARRALLWGAAAVFLTHLGLAVAVETSLPHLRDPEYGYRQLRVSEHQTAHPDRPLVLVLGTSRTRNAIDPSAMGLPDAPGSPLVFNAGQGGAWPVHFRLNLQRYRAAGVRPAAVLVELLPATLSRPGPADAMFAEFAPRLSAADLRRLGPYLADPAPLYRRWALSRANSWHALRWVVIDNLAPGWQPSKPDDPTRLMLDGYGFSPYGHETVSDELRQRQRAVVESVFAYAAGHVQVSELSERALRDLVADCRAAGIAVGFFLAPESPVFRSWYTPASRAALAAFTRVLSDELGCPVFDAPTDYGEDDFADGHHMLRPAARRFSRELADRHIGPWLASVRPPAGDRR